MMNDKNTIFYYVFFNTWSYQIKSKQVFNFKNASENILIQSNKNVNVRDDNTPLFTSIVVGDGLKKSQG